MRMHLLCLGLGVYSAQAGIMANSVIVPKPFSNTTLSSNDWNPSQGLSLQFLGSSATVQAFSGAVLSESNIGSGVPLSLSLDLPSDSGGDESYKLKISADSWTLRASTSTGLYYGMQSVRQLLRSQSALSAQEIWDKPSQNWRGLMLDLGRNMMPTSYLQSTLDRMALLKLNRLHLHLSDDQGWRLEIKKWPKLTGTGSNSATLGAKGFLSQADFIALQSYAVARGIVIVPELDMPGHTHAVKASYPNLGCGTDKGWPYTGTDVGFSKLCLTKDSSKIFTQEVFAELAAITTGPWIHMGGDEISDPNYLSYVHYTDSVITALGKYTIGWEEIAPASLQPLTTYQKWKSSFKTTSTNPWINSDCSYTYFDHPETVGGAGLTWCGASLTESKTYSTPAGTMGMEAALWGELVGDTLTSKDRLYPRLQAFAEAAWTPSTQRNFANYQSRSAALSTDGLGIGIEFNQVTPVQGSRTLVQFSEGKLISPWKLGNLFAFNSKGQILWSSALSSEALQIPSTLKGRVLLSFYPSGQNPYHQWMTIQP